MHAATSKAASRQAAADVIPVRRRAAGPGSVIPADLAGFAERSPLRLLAYLLIGLSFLFMMFPGIDLAVSALFAGRQGGFPLADDDLLTAIRDLNRLLPKLLLTGLVLCLVWQAFHPVRRAAVAPHRALFILSVYVLGGGVIVHGLKNFVGRARPDAILNFGGTDVFTVAWQMSGACLRNCSFSSGEAASAAAMLAFAVHVPLRWRTFALVLLVPLAMVFSGARIAVGRHFLSDVVVSWLILLILIVGLWRVFRQHDVAIDRAVGGCGLPLVATVKHRWMAMRARHRAGGAEKLDLPGRRAVADAADGHGAILARPDRTGIASGNACSVRHDGPVSPIAAAEPAYTLPSPSTLAIEPATHSRGTTAWQTSAT